MLRLLDASKVMMPFEDAALICSMFVLTGCSNVSVFTCALVQINSVTQANLSIHVW